MMLLPPWTNLEAMVKRIDDKGGEKITSANFKLIWKEAKEIDSPYR
jgi:hypothetical protein